MVNKVSFVVHTTKTVLYGKSARNSVVTTTGHFLTVIRQSIQHHLEYRHTGHSRLVGSDGRSNL